MCPVENWDDVHGYPTGWKKWANTNVQIEHELWKERDPILTAGAAGSLRSSKTLCLCWGRKKHSSAADDIQDIIRWHHQLLPHPGLGLLVLATTLCSAPGVKALLSVNKGAPFAPMLLWWKAGARQQHHLQQLPRDLYPLSKSRESSCTSQVLWSYWTKIHVLEKCSSDEN